VGRIGGGLLDAVADLAGANGRSGATSLCGVGFGPAIFSGVGFGAATRSRVGFGPTILSGVGFGAATFCGVGFGGVAASFLMTGLTSTWTLRTRVPVAVTTRALSDGMGAVSQPAAAVCSAVFRRGPISGP